MTLVLSDRQWVKICQCLHDSISSLSSEITHRLFIAYTWQLKPNGIIKNVYQLTALIILGELNLLWQEGSCKPTTLTRSQTYHFTKSKFILESNIHIYYLQCWIPWNLSFMLCVYVCFKTFCAKLSVARMYSLRCLIQDKNTKFKELMMVLTWKI